MESKRNDGRMIEKKNKAWEEIHKSFIASAGVNPRSVKQLKLLWKNLRAKAKKDAPLKKGKKENWWRS